MPQLAALGIAGLCFAAAVACSAASWRALLGAPLSLRQRLRSLRRRIACEHVPPRSRRRRDPDRSLRPRRARRCAPCRGSRRRGRLRALARTSAAGSRRRPHLERVSSRTRWCRRRTRTAINGMARRPAWIEARSGRARTASASRPIGVCRSGRLDRCDAGVRIAAAAIVGIALGISHPLAAALLVVPALEVAGLIPLTPANVGFAGGAAAIAFHAQGTPMHAALAAGFVLHAVETSAGVAFGAASALALGRTTGIRFHKSVSRDSPRRPPRAALRSSVSVASNLSS